MWNLKKIFVFLLLVFVQYLASQEISEVKIHSHNDYLQSLPFWTAYDNGLSSIEVDVFLKEGILYATHSKREIKEKHTLEDLYLLPLQRVYDLQIGNQQNIQLLIDIKSKAIPTLNEIINVLNNYPELLNNDKLSFVISGNRPSPEDYSSYPDFVQFDYQSLDYISDEVVNKVALVSMNFNSISNWNGVEVLSKKEVEKISFVIAEAHKLGRPFRFWGCPDTPLAWKTFMALGMDYLHTDDPYECTKFVESLERPKK
ncbi:phosphatidylinositol-specific phospholipase C/glycerophosphodiester phosphodiesterase family protein [Maribacter sp. HTCC2170]|uniref:phosphatidylinositol-specific phospholipase C/glycerophosphodiester phosphodiesterase family protein n=1 Tax=Maribacter sp. (strain HTCC2170 / KCCM 42371) TaxID=313603 RepID=UPI00006AFCC8|nr:phosphatidylinositol-specific phospholipase C/glycerophosphodiester phosphodiesterase family protein [Maribacter sp. HTCC2170]EAR01375.1 putative secreted protein [Maribacter sp. HTCC2170]